MHACTLFGSLGVKENLSTHIIIPLFPAFFSQLLFPPSPLFSQSLGWQKAREVGWGRIGKESANRKAGFHWKTKKCSWVHEAHEGGKPDLLHFPWNHVICSSLTYGHRYRNCQSRFLLFCFSFSVTHLSFSLYVSITVCLFWAAQSFVSLNTSGMYDSAAFIINSLSLLESFL